MCVHRGRADKGAREGVSTGMCDGWGRRAFPETLAVDTGKMAVRKLGVRRQHESRAVCPCVAVCGA